MNTFKKIYTALMIITVLCLTAMGLLLLDVINLSGETGEVIKLIVYTITPLTFLFSKAANVIANRTNVNLGYGITFGLLVYLLLFVLQITIKLELPMIVYLILFVILAYLILLTLIYEVPQANTSHKKFQKILTIIGTLTFVLLILFIHTIDLFILEPFQNAQLKEAIRELAPIIRAVTVGFGGITIIGIIINPMMRVYHIDNDFVAVGELDNALNRTTRYQANTQPNPNAILSDKYKKDVKKEDKIINFANKEQIVQELPTETVQELPKEKVVNQNFKQQEIPSAEIPLILNNPVPTNTTDTQPVIAITETTQTEQANTVQVTNQNTQQAPTETATETTVDPSIVEMAKATANEVVAQTTTQSTPAEPTTEVTVDPSIVEMAKATANEVVAQTTTEPTPAEPTTEVTPQQNTQSLESQINNVTMQ